MAVLARLVGALGVLGAVAWLLASAAPGGGPGWAASGAGGAGAGWPSAVGDLPRWLLAAPVEERVVSLAVLAAWGCLAWLAFVLVAVAAGAFPRGAVRDAAERVLGIAVVGAAAGALVASPAVAADGPFDRPAGSPRSPTPAAAPPPTGAAVARPGAGPGGPHVVVSGDTLWGVAARRLGPAASPSLIAATWPRWYAANRPLVGPDPHRLRPGQRLVPPGDGSDGAAR